MKSDIETALVQNICLKVIGYVIVCIGCDQFPDLIDVLATPNCIISLLLKTNNHITHRKS